MHAIAIIPARYESSRFPGKPLADKTGKPLIQHVVEQAQKAKTIEQVIVATDDQRIYDAVKAFGGYVVMTRDDHPNGTSRLAEAVRLRDDTPMKPHASSLIVNVQGDEPEIEPDVIDKLVHGLADDPDAPMATLASPFAEDEDPNDPNIVKLIIDQQGRAMYFSRSLIPYVRDPETQPITPKPLKHPGLYAYRRDFLLKYVTLPETPMEQAEKLEQLRALEHGYKIAVIQTHVRHHGIDTPEQYEAFVKRHQSTP